MEFIYDICPVCGSKNIKVISKENVEEDTIYSYVCSSCNETFSSLSKRNKYIQKSKVETSSISNATNKKDAKDIFKDNIDSVVAIYCNFANKASTGTGFIINSNYVITNAHIVFDKDDPENTTLCENVFAKFNDSDTLYELEFVFASKELDICILHFAYESNYKSCSFASGDCVTGEKVYTIGNSKGKGLAILDGIVADNVREISGHEYMMITALVTNGNSGGPVFNENGELLGMVTSGSNDALVMNYAIPLKVILEFIKEVEQNEELKIF